MRAPVLVLGVGNISRGDDALAPLLCERLEAWLAAEGIGGIEVVQDFQLNVEHALDLEERQRVLIVDAAASGPAPYELRPVRPARDWAHSTHAFSPAAVLQVFHDLGLPGPPPVELLAVRGESFELGEAVSPAAAARLETAWECLRSWCLRAGAVCAGAVG